jgi:hypothetical protein
LQAWLSIRKHVLFWAARFERNGLARLKPDHTLDPLFDPGVGPDDGISVLLELENGNILAGGSFSTFNTLPFNGLVEILAAPRVRLAGPRISDGMLVTRLITQEPEQIVFEASSDLKIWQAFQTNEPTALEVRMPIGRIGSEFVRASMR